MKKMTSTFIHSAAIFTLLMFSSCGSALDPVDPDRCDDLQAIAETFIDAAVLYGNDPSTANCKAYKKAIEDYVEIIDGCSFSSFGTGKEEARETIDSLDC